MLSFFYTCFGKRQPLPDNSQSCVEILAWFHPLYVTTHHLAIRIRDAGQTHYLSFSPKLLDGLANRPFFKLQQGVDAAFIDNDEDEMLLQGFRKAWPEVKKDLEEQKSDKKVSSIKKLSDLQTLRLAQTLPPNKQATLRQLGKPSEVIELHSLNIKAMIEKIQLYKSGSPSLSWASWSGTYLHQENTHNCASIVLDVLYTGGLGSLVHSNRDLLTVAGALLGAGYAAISSQSYLETLTEIVLEAVKDAVIGLCVGRAVGGAIEGYTEIQSFLNLLSLQGKDNIGSILGLRFTATWLSALVGIIKPGPIVPSILTMPREVLNLVQQAKLEEEACYSFTLSP